MSTHSAIHEMLHKHSDLYEEAENGGTNGVIMSESQQRAFIAAIADLCEREYVKGFEMNKQIMRIRLGLAVESDG